MVLPIVKEFCKICRFERITISYVYKDYICNNCYQNKRTFELIEKKQKLEKEIRKQNS